MSSNGDNVQIDSPELLTRQQRMRDNVFTAVMWAVYLYLWVPLVSLFAWLLGFEFAYDVMIRSGGAQDLGGILFVYGIIVLVIIAMVATWSLGNLLRYGKMRRRHAAAELSIAQMAEFFEVELAAVEQLRSTQSVSIEFDAEGRPAFGRYTIDN